MLAARLDDGAPFRRYSVNLLVDNGDTAGAPVVYEDLPTQPNLLGRVEHTTSLGALVTDFTLIRGGALHRANGGYLVLDARRLLTQPFAWEELKRALRSGELRIESLGDRLGLATVSLEPEPIPLDTKIVLVGDRLQHEAGHRRGDRRDGVGQVHVRCNSWRQRATIVAFLLLESTPQCAGRRRSRGSTPVIRLRIRCRCGPHRPGVQGRLRGLTPARNGPRSS